MPKLKQLAIVFSLTALGTAGVIMHSSSPLAPVWVAKASSDAPLLLPLSANALAALEPSNPFGLVQPVAQFKNRITKKTFGMYVTPQTSPVEHDRFTGYHTGVDAEFTDTAVAIPVVAIADGSVVISHWATGYGGVVVIRHFIQGIPVYALYGHLNPSSMVPVGSLVTSGQELGILGDDHSEQTDNVRKHLHFSLYAGAKVDVRGYVADQADLSNWMDPLSFF